MEKFAYGFAEHACAIVGRPIMIPIALEKYNSRVIVFAACQVCGKKEFEKDVDKAAAPSKGFYMTV